MGDAGTAGDGSVAPPKARAAAEHDRARSTIRVVLGVATVAVLVGWSVGTPIAGDAVAPFLVMTALGVGSRLAQVRHRGPALNLALVFAGAQVLLVDGTLAVWGAALIGLAGLLRGDPWSRAGMSVATLTLAQSVGAGARIAADRVLADQLLVGSGGAGALAVRRFGVLTALAVAIALALAWQTMRWLSAWLDRRSRTDAWRARSEARWLLDTSLGALAVVTAIAWAVAPALVLLVLIPLLTVWRSFNAPVVGDRSTDELTGLGSSGLLRMALTEELARAAQFDRPVGCLIVHIDDLPRTRLRAGEAAVAEVVRAVGRVAANVAREYDIVARIGEDVVAVVLPEVQEAGAVAVAERIRDLVGATPVWVDGERVPTTVSVGVATFPADADSRETLLTEAELASDYATIAGGDRVQLAAQLPAGFRASPAGRAEETTTTVVPRTEPLAPDQLVRATPEPFADAMPRTDRLLAAAAAAALVASVIAISLVPAGVPLALTLLFAGLAVGAEWFAESIYGRANSSWAAVPLIALAVSRSSSPSAVVLAAVLVAAGGGALRGVRLRQGAFNAAVLMLAALAAWVVARPLLDLRGEGLLGAVAVGIAAGAAFFLIDTWLVATALGIAGRGAVFEVWREDLLWLVPHQLGMGLLAGAMAYAQANLGTGGTLVLVLPALALHLAQRQFVRRTRENVLQLRYLNDDVTDANRRIVRVNERLTEALEQVNSGYLVTVESLAVAVDAKDSYTGSHIDRVERYGKRMLEVLDPTLTDDEALLWGFRLHDVGKIGVPDRVLQKPGPLDDEEWTLMRRHPEIGAQIVEAAPFLQGARDVILHHHERWDGRGYPYGLAEQAIPFTARLFTVVDAYDAMTSTRPYRQGMPIEQAVQELVRTSGSQFDPEMIEAFLQIPFDELETIRVHVESVREGRSRSGSPLIDLTAFLTQGADAEPA
ncbi:MAG: diguanylate cyclase [Actinobacteria bacterium]|nr:diguanylate cyclase [Actinomycetota bacterium]